MSYRALSMKNKVLGPEDLLSLTPQHCSRSMAHYSPVGFGVPCLS